MISAYLAHPAFAGTPERFIDAAERAYARGEFARAAEFYAQACSARPDDLYNRVCLVDALSLAGRTAAAAREAGALTEAHPGSAEARFVAGLLAMRRGEMEKAERSFRRAVARAPGSARMRVELALLLVRTGRAAEAFTKAARVAEDADAASDARYIVALAHRMAGDERGALPWFEAALALRPGDLYAAAEVYASRRALGERPAAAVWFRGAPDHPARILTDALHDGVLARRDIELHREEVALLDARGDPDAGAVLALLLAATGDPRAPGAAEAATRARPESRLARLAFAAACAPEDAPRAAGLMREAFAPGADLFHPHLFLKIAASFPALPPDEIRSIGARIAAKHPPPPAAPFPKLR